MAYRCPVGSTLRAVDGGTAASKPIPVLDAWAILLAPAAGMRLTACPSIGRHEK